MAGCFLAKGKLPGPVADLHIHHRDVFSRLIREGELGFSDAYLEDWWSSSDLPGNELKTPG